MIDRRLHMLRMVRQLGTITEAADALHLTPSAVSQQLRTLARDLDVELLQPKGRGIRLTAAADILLEHADVLFARWEQARTDLDAQQAGQRGTVRVCGFPSAVAALLAPVARQLLRDTPGLRIEIAQAEPSESLDMLLAGTADLAVLEVSAATPTAVDARFDQQHLLDEAQQLIVAVDHRLADRDAVALAEVAQEPWIAGPDAYRQIVQLTCNQAGFTPQVAHRALDWSAYAALVAAGLGVALAPRLAMIPADAVRRLELTDRPTASRRILTCVRRGSQDQPTIQRVRQALAAFVEQR